MEIPLLVLALIIAALVVAIGIVRVRGASDTERGSLPGKGDHIIDAEYSSGAGGGHHSQYRVPKDPQEYAKLFVPKEK